jgi:hypothetical protein
MYEDALVEEEQNEEQEQEQEEIHSSCDPACIHAYAFVEPLPSDEPGIYKEKWRCLDCLDERELRVHTGVCDY